MRPKLGGLTCIEDLQRSQTRFLHDRLEEQKLQKKKPHCLPCQGKATY